MLIFPQASSSTDALTAWATVGLGAFTVILAGIALWQAILTRNALKAADRDTLEATRARIDQAAPRVTFVATMPMDNQTEWLVALQPDTDYQVPRDADGSVAVAGWFRSINEGKSTGIVQVPDGTLIVAEDDYFALTLPELRAAINPDLSRPPASVFVLCPGENKYLLVEVRKSVGAWVEGCNVFFAADGRVEGTMRDHAVEVVVDDTFADGIRDTTRLVFHLEPLARSGKSWRSTTLRPELRVERTVREYRRARGTRDPAASHGRWVDTLAPPG